MELPPTCGGGDVRCGSSPEAGVSILGIVSRVETACGECGGREREEAWKGRGQGVQTCGARYSRKVALADGAVRLSSVLVLLFLRPAVSGVWWRFLFLLPAAPPLVACVV
jgi:hypothetical protein